LDQTCFYPEGGGQPCDLGKIGNTIVLDVQISKGMIIHTTDTGPIGPNLSCRVDWVGRYDHMQQHTGQHLLTRCFLKSADVNTVGISLGADYSYIELDSDSISEADRLEAGEMAARLIAEALPITVRWIERDRLQTLRGELAKHLAVSLIQDAETRGEIRLVTHVVEGWGMNEITALANEVASQGKAVALIGSKADKAAVAFASSPDAGVDVGKLMSVSTKAVDGKGGGKPTLARGGCPDPSRLDELLKKAREAFFHL